MTDSMHPALLDVTGLSVSIDNRKIVDGLSFSIRRGEILAIVGESGSGKSLTLLALARLLPPAARLSAGSVILEGRDLAEVSEAEMGNFRGKSLSLIFQEPSSSLDPLMTIGNQLIEAVLAHHQMAGSQARAKAIAMLRAVGIADPERRMDQYPFEFSGGMCQRVMIAMALICNPALLLADEPTTALDVTIQAQILDLIRQMRKETGTAVLLITHDIGVVAEMAERVLVMYAGKIVEEALIDDLLDHPRHPYTQLLLKSLPSLEGEPKSELATIAGSVPAVGLMLPGCRFAPRCPLAKARCHAEEPNLVTVAEAHSSACWYSDDVATLAGALT